MVSKYLSFNFQNSCYNYLIPVSVHLAVSPISRFSIFILFVYLFICPLFTFLEIWAKKVRRLEQNLTALASQLVINFLILYGTKMIKFYKLLHCQQLLTFPSVLYQELFQYSSLFLLKHFNPQFYMFL